MRAAGLRWLVCGVAGVLMLLGATAVGLLAHDWVEATRHENAGMGCPAAGGVLDEDDLSCVRTAADGTVTEVQYSVNPSTFEGIFVVALAVVFTLAFELALIGLLWLTWRWFRQSPARAAPSNGALP
jgi:hypothetical protein